MKTKRSVICQLLMFLLLVLFTSGCGVSYMVKGKVVDAETGKPIQGAAVGIFWYDYSGRSCLMPPFSSGQHDIETASSLTDADGVFKIPESPLKKYKMGVYKKGYVCWSSETIFHPERPWEEALETRILSWVVPGMVIRLEPWKEGYSAFGHSTFVGSVNRAVDGARHFEEATREERSIEERFQHELGEKENRQIEETRHRYAPHPAGKRCLQRLPRWE